MISLEEINRTILELEQKDTSYTVCERLAWLYVVRDHLVQPHQEELLKGGDSEFMQAVSGKETTAVMSIIDELMQTLNVVQNRLYQSVINEIKGI